MKNSPSFKVAAAIQFGSKYFEQFVQLGITMVLARLLTPQDYGVMAVVLVFLGFFSALSTMGIGAAIVQYKDLEKRECDALFSFTLLIGVALAVLFCALSVPVSVAYSNSSLVQYMGICSLTIMFNAWDMVPNGIMYRDKRFLAIGIRLIVATAVSGLVAVVMAINGFGIYSLLANNVLQALIVFAWNFFGSKTKFNNWHFLQPLKRVFRFSIFQFFSRIVQYVTLNIDTMFIGAFFGPTSLGAYDKGYRLTRYPVNIIPGTLNPVLKSYFSSSQDNMDEFVGLFNKVEKALSIFGVFVTVFCFFEAGDLILLAYGSQWTESVPVFQALSLSIVVQMMCYTFYAVLEGVKRTDYLFRMTVSNAVIIICCVVLGMMSGSIVVTAYCVSAGFILFAIPGIYYTIRKALSLSVLGWLRQFLPEFLSGLIVSAVYLVMGHVVNFDNMIVSLATYLVVGVLVYGLLLAATGQIKYLSMFVRRK